MENENVKAIKLIMDDGERYVAFIDSSGNLFKMKLEKAQKLYFETVKNLFESMIPANTTLTAEK